MDSTLNQQEPQDTLAQRTHHRPHQHAWKFACEHDEPTLEYNSRNRRQQVLEVTHACPPEHVPIDPSTQNATCVAISSPTTNQKKYKRPLETREPLTKTNEPQCTHNKVNDNSSKSYTIQQLYRGVQARSKIRTDTFHRMEKRCSATKLLHTTDRRRTLGHRQRPQPQ